MAYSESSTYGATEAARTPRQPSSFWTSPPSGTTRSRRTSAQWPGVRAEYGWHPPFEGESPTQPNRIEVVFSAHSDVILSQDAKQYDVQVRPGAMYIVRDPATTLLRCREPSDTLEMFVGDQYLDAVAQSLDLDRPRYTPTLGDTIRVALPYDPVALGLAHILRRACVSDLALSEVEASTIGMRLAELVIDPEHSAARRLPKASGRLDSDTLIRVVDYVESRLARSITVLDLAAIAGLSLFHFTRAFRNSMGMPPHQYVIGRRLERAKILLMSTNMIVQDIAWTLGFENLSHFRRKFHEQFGITPGRLRGLQ